MIWTKKNRFLIDAWVEHVTCFTKCNSCSWCALLKWAGVKHSHLNCCFSSIFFDCFSSTILNRHFSFRVRWMLLQVLWKKAEQNKKKCKRTAVAAMASTAFTSAVCRFKVQNSSNTNNNNFDDSWMHKKVRYKYRRNRRKRTGTVL